MKIDPELAKAKLIELISYEGDFTNALEVLTGFQQLAKAVNSPLEGRALKAASWFNRVVAYIAVYKESLAEELKGGEITNESKQVQNQDQQAGQYVQVQNSGADDGGK